MKKKICLFLSFVLIFSFIFSLSVSATSPDTVSNDVSFGGFSNSFPIVPNASLYQARCTTLYAHQEDINVLINQGFELATKNTASYSYNFDYSYIVYVSNATDNMAGITVSFWDPDAVLSFYPDFATASSGNIVANMTIIADDSALKIDSSTGKPIPKMGKLFIGYNVEKNTFRYDWWGVIRSGDKFTVGAELDSTKLNDYCIQTYTNGWYQRAPIIGWYGENLYFEYAGNEIPYLAIFNTGDDVESDSVVTDDDYLKIVEDENTLGLAGYLGSALNKITSKVSGMFNGLKDTVSSVGEEIKNSLSSVGESIVSGVSSVFSNVVGALEEKLGVDIAGIKEEIAGIKEKINKVSEIFGALHSFGLDENGNFDVVTMLEAVFVPDHDYIEEKKVAFYDANFGWVSDIEGYTQSFINMISYAAQNAIVPEIVFPAGTYGSFVLKNDVVWSFSWWLPFKPIADAVLSAFCYLFFGYRIITSLPSIIGGIASPFTSHSVSAGSSITRKKGD